MKKLDHISLLLKTLWWFLIRVKPKVLTLAYEANDLAPLLLLSVSFVPFQPHWCPCFPSNILDVLLPQDLYIWCSFCLKHSSWYLHYYSLIFFQSLFNGTSTRASLFTSLQTVPPTPQWWYTPALFPPLYFGIVLINWHITCIYLFVFFLSISLSSRMDRYFYLFAHCWLKCLKSTWHTIGAE